MHPVDKHNRDEYVRHIEARLAEAERLLREAAAILAAETDQRRRDAFACEIHNAMTADSA